MKRKRVFDPNDPYSAAIKSLVKKTLITTGIIVLVGIMGIGYIAVKSGLKMSSKQKKEQSSVLATAQPKEEVLAESAYPSQAASPAPTLIPSSSPTPTNTASATPSNSPSPSPSPSASPTLTPSPTAKSTTIKSDPTLDGYITGKGTVITNGEIRVGSINNTPARGFITYDVSSLNARNITKAKIRIYELGVVNNPFQNSTDIRIDLVNTGSSLDTGDYGTSSLLAAFSIVTNSPSPGWREIDILEALKKTKETNRQYLQLRLHFNFESESGDQYVKFESGNNTQKSNNIPEIIYEAN